MFDPPFMAFPSQGKTVFAHDPVQSYFFVVNLQATSFHEVPVGIEPTASGLEAHAPTIGGTKDHVDFFMASSITIAISARADCLLL